MTAFTVSHRSTMVCCFHFHSTLGFKIFPSWFSSPNKSSFNMMLIFINLCIFCKFSCWWFIDLFHCGQIEEKYVTSSVSLRLVLYSIIVFILKKYHQLLRWACILQGLHGKVCRCLLGSPNLWYHLTPMFLYFNLESVIKSALWYCVTVNLWLHV